MIRRRGFTLIEVLLATGLAAVISAAVLVPMIYTVNSLEKAGNEFGRASDRGIAASLIFRDIRNSSPELPVPVIKTEVKNSLAVKNDGRLTVWTRSPSNEGKAAGAVAYKILKDTDGEGYSLYRWILPPDTAVSSRSGIFRDEKASARGPAERDTDGLKREEGKLVLKNIEGIIFEAHDGIEWKQEYSGAIPSAFKIRIISAGGEDVYEETLPFTQ